MHVFEIPFIRTLGNVIPYYSEGLTWQDGSLEFDLPMNKLSEMFNVNHFIVSQVNPHVISFSTIGAINLKMCFGVFLLISLFDRFQDGSTTGSPD